MTTDLNLAIVEQRKGKLADNLFWLMLACIIGAVVASAFSGIVCLSIVGVLIVTGIIHNVVGKSKVVGYCVLTSNMLSLRKDGTTVNYQLKDIKGLAILYFAYEGENVGLRVLSLSDGDDNFIEFWDEGKRTRFMVRLKEDQLTSLINIMRVWKNEGVEFKFSSPRRRIAF